MSNPHQGLVADLLDTIADYPIPGSFDAFMSESVYRALLTKAGWSAQDIEANLAQMHADSEKETQE